MQIEKVNRNEIPPGAKLLTEEEAHDEYWKFIDKKAPVSESWPFVWGIPSLGAVSFITNHALLLHYRGKLKMGKRGTIFWAVSLAGLPAIGSIILHQHFVTKNILLQKSCPICLQTRAYVIQLSTAFAYSLTVTPLICFLQADMYGTYNVPGYYNKEQRLKMWQLYLKFTKRASKKIYFCFLLNTIATTVVIGYEMKAFMKIQEIMAGKVEAPESKKDK